jgi:hypothetical protein
MSFRRDIPGMKRTSVALVLSLLGSGCWAPPDDPAAGAQAPPPAAALTEISSTTPLDQGLAMLEAELDPVLQDDLDDADRNARLLRAEAITDRLLETRLPFEWLSTENYGLDSRLRQIQALADRVIAQLRSSAPRDSLHADVATLLTVVGDLRAAIAEGGTRAPPSLEQLLSDFEANRRRPPPAPRPPPAATPPDTTA